MLLSILPLNMDLGPAFRVNLRPTAAFATREASESTVSPPISKESAPVSPLILAAPKKLQVVSTPNSETQSKVSDHAPFTIVVDNYMLFSICPRSPVVHYHALHLVPPCKQLRD